MVKIKSVLIIFLCVILFSGCEKVGTAPLIWEKNDFECEFSHTVCGETVRARLRSSIVSDGTREQELKILEPSSLSGLTLTQNTGEWSADFMGEKIDPSFFSSLTGITELFSCEGKLEKVGSEKILGETADILILTTPQGDSREICISQNSAMPLLIRDGQIEVKIIFFECG